MGKQQSRGIQYRITAGAAVVRKQEEEEVRSDDASTDEKANKSEGNRPAQQATGATPLPNDGAGIHDGPSPACC